MTMYADVCTAVHELCMCLDQLSEPELDVELFNRAIRMNIEPDEIKATEIYEAVRIHLMTIRWHIPEVMIVRGIHPDKIFYPFFESPHKPELMTYGPRVLSGMDMYLLARGHHQEHPIRLVEDECTDTRLVITMEIETTP